MIRHIWCFFLVLWSTTAIAQTGTGSPYSFGGFGEITFRGNHLNRAMGGLEVYNDSIHVNLSNPAGYGTLKTTNYLVGVNYKNTTLKSPTEKDRIATGALDYLAINIPTGKFGFGFGLKPYSSLGYRLQVIDESVTPNVFNRFEGEGGLNQAFLSIGMPLFRYFSIGATLNYGFGNLTFRNSKQIEGIERSSYFESNSSLSGISFKYAANLKIPVKSYEFHAYASYTPKATIYSQNAQLFYTRSNNTQDLGDFEEIDLKADGLDETTLNLPKNTTFGLGLGKDKKWFLGGQYTQSASAGFKNDFTSVSNVTYTDGNTFALGGFYLPEYGSLTSYYKRIVYRAGFRSSTTGLVVNGNTLKESGISFGVGLPLQQFSNVNIGLEFGRRGTFENDLIKENYWAILVGFSLNDIWFIKRKFN
jgi:hypothetical protein